MASFAGYHVGRSFAGHPLEDECPCPQELCGLVAWDRVDPGCAQHAPSKTIRQGHHAADCPAVHVGTSA